MYFFTFIFLAFRSTVCRDVKLVPWILEIKTLQDFFFRWEKPLLSFSSLGEVIVFLNQFKIACFTRTLRSPHNSETWQCPRYDISNWNLDENPDLLTNCTLIISDCSNTLQLRCFLKYEHKLLWQNHVRITAIQNHRGLLYFRKPILWILASLRWKSAYFAVATFKNHSYFSFIIDNL